MLWAARGLKRVDPTATRALGPLKASLISLPSEGQHAVRVCRESNPDLPIHSPDRYLYATVADGTDRGFLEHLDEPAMLLCLDSIYIVYRNADFAWQTV